MCELSSPEIHLPRETDCGIIGSAEPVYSRRRPCRHRCLELTVFGFPGVAGDGMPGKNVQRKLGTTRGSPRCSRTAKASRISQTVKSRCAREWGGWGRLSDDGPGHYNPDPSEGPWGRWSIPQRKRRATQVSEPRPDLRIGETCVDLLVELIDDFGRCVFGRTDAHPGACLIARKELPKRRFLRRHAADAT